MTKQKLHKIMRFKVFLNETIQEYVVLILVRNNFDILIFFEKCKTFLCVQILLLHYCYHKTLSYPNILLHSMCIIFDSWLRSEISKVSYLEKCICSKSFAFHFLEIKHTMANLPCRTRGQVSFNRWHSCHLPSSYNTADMF